MSVYVIVFLILVAVWIAAGRFFATRPLIAKALSRWGHILLPVVLIGIGLLILIEGGAFGLEPHNRRSRVAVLSEAAARRAPSLALPAYTEASPSGSNPAESCSCCPAASASARARYNEATEGRLPAFFPVVMVSLAAISGTGTPWARSVRAKVSMSSSITLGRPPWWPREAAICCPSRGLSRM
ncbi:hypothetical protein [Streptosporangium canum]|uniref:hypothetical protein n=1 Tax=Streptosporangium canum TaxID=324952 RepID=UPI003F4DBC56